MQRSSPHRPSASVQTSPLRPEAPPALRALRAHQARPAHRALRAPRTVRPLEAPLPDRLRALRLRVRHLQAQQADRPVPQRTALPAHLSVALPARLPAAQAATAHQATIRSVAQAALPLLQPAAQAVRLPVALQRQATTLRSEGLQLPPATAMAQRPADSQTQLPAAQAATAHQAMTRPAGPAALSTVHLALQAQLTVHLALQALLTIRSEGLRPLQAQAQEGHLLQPLLARPDVSRVHLRPAIQ